MPDSALGSSNLDEWYKDLTGNVADAYAKLDTKLIELAFETMNQDESQFLFQKRRRFMRHLQK
ncbi:hypothetical protein QUB72_00525 [Enterococcus faecium]|nr:hypothetical protein [Enterococcus faecium]